MALIFLEEFWRRQVYYDLPLYRSPRLKLRTRTSRAGASPLPTININTREYSKLRLRSPAHFLPDLALLAHDN